MIEVKTSRPPHVLTFEGRGKQGHALCEILS